MSLSAIIAIIKLIPTIKAIFDDLVALYIASEIASMKVAHRKGIRKALDEYDQRDLERAIGNPNAGEPSGTPGADVVDTLPGVE